MPKTGALLVIMLLASKHSLENKWFHHLILSVRCHKVTGMTIYNN